MYLTVEKFLVPEIDCGDHFEIEGLKRLGNVSQQFIKMFKDELSSMKSNGRTGLIYAKGVTIDSGITCLKQEVEGISILPQKTMPVVLELTQHGLYRYAKAFSGINFEFAEVESSSCSSSLTAVVKAVKYIEMYNLDEVLIVTDERNSQSTIKIFKESRIDVKPGDGFAIARVSRDKIDDSSVYIIDAKQSFIPGSNPFDVTEEGYSRVSGFKTEYLKPHDPGSEGTGLAESSAVSRYEKSSIFSYKKKFGHMQGASGLVELCYMLDNESINGSVQCLASGVGGFYAGIILTKWS